MPKLDPSDSKAANPPQAIAEPKTKKNPNSKALGSKAAVSPEAKKSPLKKASPNPAKNPPSESTSVALTPGARKVSGASETAASESRDGSEPVKAPKNTGGAKLGGSTGQEKGKAEPPKAREVVYPELRTSVLRGEKALTVAQAKKILCWREESENIKFGSDYLLMDEYEKKIRCYNNVGNRPYDQSLAALWKSEILRKKWKLNGESMVIGKYGSTLSCVHRLTALVLAGQAYAKAPDKYPLWDKEPTIECILVQGIEENDETVNTLDTAKPRSLTDVIYRSEYFASYKPKERKEVAARTTGAIQMLWHRTGAKEFAFANKRTHSESLEYLSRHPRLLECVKHIFEEDSESKISQILKPGYAAALLYLMGSAKTEREPYHEARNRANEKMLDWSLWDKAQAFFVLLASDNEAVIGLRQAYVAMVEGMTTGSSPTVWERVALVVKAWNAFSNDDPVDPSNLELKYVQNDEHELVLDETPIVGGIDLGGVI